MDLTHTVEEGIRLAECVITSSCLQSLALSKHTVGRRTLQSACGYQYPQFPSLFTVLQHSCVTDIHSGRIEL